MRGNYEKNRIKRESLRDFLDENEKKPLSSKEKKALLSRFLSLNTAKEDRQYRY